MSGIIGTSHSKSKVIGRSKDIAKAWVNFNGNGTIAIQTSFGVSSVTDSSTGIYRINFSSQNQDIASCVVMGSSSYWEFIGTLNIAYADIEIRNNSNVSSDTDKICVAIFNL
jgi:hypothetical protein